MRSELGEALFVVEAVCVELQYTQVLAAFSDRGDADRFAEAQDRTFTLVEYHHDQIWLPDRIIESIANSGDDLVRLSVPPWNEPRTTRVTLQYVVFEIPWNQMLGRFLPVTKDGHPGPTLQPPDGSTAPVADIVKLPGTGGSKSAARRVRLGSVLARAYASHYNQRPVPFEATPGVAVRVTPNTDLPPEELKRREIERYRAFVRGK